MEYYERLESLVHGLVLIDHDRDAFEIASVVPSAPSIVGRVSQVLLPWSLLDHVKLYKAAMQH